MLANRLRKNLARLGPWARRERLDAWRVYDRDIPEYPWTIDLYGERVLATRIETAVGRRQAVGTQEQEEQAVTEAITEVLGVAATKVSLRARQRHRSIERQAQGVPANEFPVGERDLKFLVNLEDYLDTGLFLDHREARRRVGERSGGARVLNLFAYTGSFSVYAARGGAKRTVSVDLSAPYLAWAERNLRLNELFGPKHDLVREDVFAFLQASRDSYDLIVLDPPTVSKSARGRSFDIQSAHVDLIKAAASRLAERGTLFFSTNDRSFRLDSAAFRDLQVTDVCEATQSHDFRQPVHLAWELRRSH